MEDTQRWIIKPTAELEEIAGQPEAREEEPSAHMEAPDIIITDIRMNGRRAEMMLNEEKPARYITPAVSSSTKKPPAWAWIICQSLQRK